MDKEPHMDTESGSGVTTDSPGSSSYGSAIFSRSHHFTVAGGTFNNNFNNVTNNYTGAPVVPPDFRMIPMGDIDLLEEIHLNNETGVVYSAKIDGRKSGVTVALYQGDGAEEEWCQDIVNYMTVRCVEQRVRVEYMPHFSMMVLFELNWRTRELDICIRSDTVRTIPGSLFTPPEVDWLIMHTLGGPPNPMHYEQYASLEPSHDVTFVTFIQNGNIRCHILLNWTEMQPNWVQNTRK
ncbi:hypothetical protein B0H13DRAFT_2506341 [Mycena leptocephala]|nr:hypothetical protein B0H13DRAFT_2506341 [Mycena leptocephala]